MQRIYNPEAGYEYVDLVNIENDTFLRYKVENYSEKNHIWDFFSIKSVDRITDFTDEYNIRFLRVYFNDGRSITCEASSSLARELLKIFFTEPLSINSTIPPSVIEQYLLDNYWTYEGKYKSYIHGESMGKMFLFHEHQKMFFCFVPEEQNSSFYKDELFDCLVAISKQKRESIQKILEELECYTKQASKD